MPLMEPNSSYLASLINPVPSKDDASDLTNANVGDVVVVLSRNAWRRGVVVKAGPKNVVVAYVTAGGVRDSEKSIRWDAGRDLANEERDERKYRTRDFYYSVEVANAGPGHPHLHFYADKEARHAHEVAIRDAGVDAYVEPRVKQAVESARAIKEAAMKLLAEGNLTAYATITNVTIRRSDGSRP